MDSGEKKLAMLTQEVEQFGRDPMNLMLEKRFMVKKFYLGLVTEARGLFVLAKAEADSWLRRSLDPVMMRIRDHKQQLEMRIENIRQVHDNLDNLQARTVALKEQLATLEIQQREINAIVQGLNCTARQSG